MGSLGSSIVYGILKITGLVKSKDMEVVNSLKLGGSINIISGQAADNISTEHPLQIGPTTGANLRITGSDIKAINNGAYSILHLNYNGGEVRANNQRILTTGDEGSGNGIDADTVDGEHASAFANASHSHSYVPLSGGTVTNDLTVNGMSDVHIRTWENGVRKILNPKGGTYNLTSSNINGAIKINLPGHENYSSMLRMIVDVYDYAGGSSFTVSLGGYLYSSFNWVNEFAYFESTSSMQVTPAVRFAIDTAGYGVIYIGDVGATGQYDYSVISVRELIIGHSGDDNAQWDNALNISYATSYGTDAIKGTITGKKLDADTLDGEHASAFANASHSHTEVNGIKVTVGTSAPSSPSTNDIWVDTGG